MRSLQAPAGWRLWTALGREDKHGACTQTRAEPPSCPRHITPMIVCGQYAQSHGRHLYAQDLGAAVLNPLMM